MLTFLCANLSLQFSHPCHWHEVCQLNPLSSGRRDNSLKTLNLLSMEDVVNMSRRTGWLSPLFCCLCVVKHCHDEGGHYRLEIFTLLHRTVYSAAAADWDMRLKRKKIKLCIWTIEWMWRTVNNPESAYELVSNV